MSEQQKNVPVESAAEGLQKTEMSVITVMAMIFCLVSAGCFGMEEAIPELFEKKARNAPMPDWLREDYEKKINKSVKKS